MSPISPNQEESVPQARRSRWGILLPAAGAVLACIVFFSPARQATDVQLDASNYASYAYFTARGFSFGTDVVPLAGPYGFVPYGAWYAGFLFWKRFALELLTKLVFGGLIVWFMARHPQRRILGWVWLATLVVMTPLALDLLYDLPILFAGLALVHFHVTTGRRSLQIACGLAAYLALLTLFKGTQAMLAGATLGLLGLQSLFTRDFRRLPWIIGTYLATLIILLLVAGQNPLNLPRYLHGVMDLSSGYNAAMVLDEPNLAFLTGVGALVALQLLVLVGLLLQWRQPAALAGGLLLAGFNFIQWKHGFVRADGHVYIFYHYACIASLTILLFLGGTAAPFRWQRYLAGTLVLIAFGCGFLGDGPGSLHRHGWALRQLAKDIPFSFHQITAPAAEKKRLDADLVAQRDLADLPTVRDIVGHDRIDFFGTEHGYLMLNRLNYRPRPMGGGTFSVFTPWLQDINTACLASPATRPDYFLVKPSTIDERFLAQDDPGTLRALLELYTPVASEQGLLLFRAKPGSPALPVPRLLKTQPLVLNEPVTPPEVRPDEMLLVSFTLPPSLRGRLRTTLYKPTLIYMHMIGGGILNPSFRRVIPNLFVNPVLLSPVIENNHDLLALYQGVPGKQVREFRLITEHPEQLALSEMKIHFYAAPRPSPEPAKAIRLNQILLFPVANVAPISIEPAGAPFRTVENRRVQMAEAPAQIRFALNGRENEIRFMYGIEPEAYTNGRTDGVEFFVDLVPLGRPQHTIFHRWLRPLTFQADRGIQSQRVILPPVPAGSTLLLRTGYGGHNDGESDRSYFTSIRLLEGQFLPEQFPRFAQLPVAVDGATSGAVDVAGRKIFMLNSPGSLIFSLKGDEKKLNFTAGILPGAYTNPGNSDGVEFIVTLHASDGTDTIIFRQLLNPRNNAGDRGDRPLAVPLPDFAPGTKLILTASPGPANSIDWDWSYIESLRFE